MCLKVYLCTNGRMIGIGIDNEVTSAAMKAIRDVMDRNTCLDDYDKLRHGSQNRKLYIQLGVPLSPTSGINETNIDSTSGNSSNAIDETSLLQQLFPNSCRRQLPPYIRIQTGGLNVHSLNAKSSSGCSIERRVVVAHLSFVDEAQQCTPIDQGQTLSSIGMSIQKQHYEVESGAPNASTNTNEKLLGGSTKHGFHSSNVSVLEAEKRDCSISHDVKSIIFKDGITQPCIRRHEPAAHRASYSSMDMLAHISASIIDEEKNENVSVVVDNYKKISSDTIKSCHKIEKIRGIQRELPLLHKTHKNQARHFVQHSYQDLMKEIPPVIYENRLDNIPMSTSSLLAFPMKLHEALSQIETDKKEHIFGWLPHGRSFKIHSQHDFAAIVLPHYFVMTKKSSFLRQLNLYGFRRISDGSYYHERFLRGMKFLCLSMQRQKVNGNGVRAAGNPDKEPNLSDYPNCPPSLPQQQDMHKISIGRRIDAESFASKTEQIIVGQESIHIHESGSSIDDDRGVRSESGSSSLNSSDECNDYNNDADIELDGSLQAVSPSSSSIMVSYQECMVDHPRQDNFPVKLQRILDELEQSGQTDIISWLPHGRAFMVHNVDRFVQQILPLHFNQTKYTSFQRQLHMYHITRIGQGPDKGAYYHNQLLRGQPALSKGVRRTTATTENGNSKSSVVSRRSTGSDNRMGSKTHVVSTLPIVPS